MATIKKVSARNPARIKSVIKMLDAALEERGEFLILRGVVDPGSLDAILVPDYQRGVLSPATINGLARAIKDSKVPDIELAVRGGDFKEREGCFYIKDPVFVVDGLQRITGARRVMQDGGEPYLGATLYFNTTIPWERERFRILNAERVKVSANVLLRNIRSENIAVRLIYEMTQKDRNFVLHERVAWGQNQKRTEVLTALVMMKTIRALHAHLGGKLGSRWDQVAESMSRLMAATDRGILMKNVATFFNVLDSCWSIRNVVFTERQTHLKGTFLYAFADVLSRHLNFWVDQRLVVERHLLRKIALFPIHDPEIKALAHSAGQSRPLLGHLLIDHINAGKRTGHLKPRTKEPCITGEELDEAPEAKAAAA